MVLAQSRPAAVFAEPLTVAAVFGSTRRTIGHLVLPPEIAIKAAFGEVKLDLSDATLPSDHVVLICESLCASVEITLPDGVTIADHTATVMASHCVRQSPPQQHGPIVHLEGWTVCSDLKVRTATQAVATTVTWS